MTPNGSRTTTDTTRTTPSTWITRPWSPLLAFLGLTFAITWSAWGLLLALGGEPTAGPAQLVLWVLGGLGPAAAIIAARLEGRAALRELWHGLLRWRVGAGWYALLLLPLVVAVATVALLGWRVDPDVSVVGAAIIAVPMFVVMAVVGGGLEEVGWRGYAQPRLQARIGQLPAALVIGLIWALWHLPLYAMVGTSQSDSSLGWFTLQAVALSIILAWIYNGTGSSILLPVLFHAAVNTSYSTVLSTVDVVAQPRFEMVAALLMSAAALVVTGLGHSTETSARRQQPARR